MALACAAYAVAQRRRVGAPWRNVHWRTGAISLMLSSASPSVARFLAPLFLPPSTPSPSVTKDMV